MHVKNHSSVSHPRVLSRLAGCVGFTGIQYFLLGVTINAVLGLTQRWQESIHSAPADHIKARVYIPPGSLQSGLFGQTLSQAPKKGRSKDNFSFPKASADVCEAAAPSAKERLSGGRADTGSADAQSSCLGCLAGSSRPRKKDPCTHFGWMVGRPYNFQSKEILACVCVCLRCSFHSGIC